MDVGQVLRRIPKMDALLALPEISQACERFSYPEVKHLIGQELDRIRRQVLAGALDEVPAQEDIAAHVLGGLEASGAFSLRPVINATGVVLHTNLGRAPFGERMARHVAQVAAGYSNLEYNLARGKRGSRYVHVEHLLCELTGAEAAMVVNNNAAAVLLAGYEKDKAAAAALLGDFRAVAAAGLRGCASTPLTGDAARRALSLADAAIQRLAAQVNPKITLSVLAAKLG